MEEAVIEQLKTIRDPEIPIDIVELGLIYNISFEKIQTFSPDGENSMQENKCNILMTLTTAWCPVAQEMPIWVKEAALKVKGVNECDVKVTFDPAWARDNITEAGKLELGLM
jgi:metal-sulfur cluster biosynthetic enzyme